MSRPLGSVVFGHLGDKRGRRFVLVLTLVLMGFASLFRAYQTTTAISLYVVGALCVTCAALLAARETGQSALED